MRAHVTRDLGEWDSATARLLARDPVANTLPLSIAATLRAGGGFGTEVPWFAWVTDDDDVVGAALRTPPYLLAVTDLPEAAAACLGRAVADAAVPGLLARPDVATAVAAGAGRGYHVRMRELQYRLGTLTPPVGIPGGARPATDADEDLVVEWTAAFETETGLFVQGDPREALRRRQARGDALWLWCVDGQPVSMAGHTAPVAGVPRVGPVYTPPEHRGRGYGGAATAAVCASALADGATACTLFADADNPTANRLYRRLGFSVVREMVEAVFDDTSSG